MPDPKTPLYFRFFNEIGIINQLASTMFEARMPAGMLVSHFSVLNHLSRVADGQTPLKLARAFQVPKTTMTHTLAALERANLVEMRPNPQDGRSKQVWLTEAGRTFRDQAIASLAPDIGDLARDFPADRIEAALPHLEALRKILDARRD